MAKGRWIGTCRWVGHNIVVRKRIRWFEYCACLRCGKTGWRYVRAAGEGDTRP